MKKSCVIFILFVLGGCYRSPKDTIMDEIELQNGMTIKCQMLNEQTFSKLLTDKKGEAIEKYSLAFGIEVYELQNSHVIVKEGNYYTLYFSLRDLDKVLFHSEAGVNGQEILLNKNYFGKDFPQHTSFLIKELLSELNLSENAQVDKDLLLLIQAEVIKRPDAEDFEKKHLLHFIAVIGNALINKYSASWNMQLASDQQTWNPYLVVKEENVQFFTYLYEDIFMVDKSSNTFLTESYETVTGIIEYNLM